MKGIKRYQDFRAVESNPVTTSASFSLAQRQIMFVLKHPEQILPSQILKHEAYVLAICKCFVEFDYKISCTFVAFFVQKVQYLFLSLHMVNSLLVCYAVFFNLL